MVFNCLSYLYESYSKQWCRVHGAWKACEYRSSEKTPYVLVDAGCLLICATDGMPKCHNFLFLGQKKSGELAGVDSALISKTVLIGKACLADVTY